MEFTTLISVLNKLSKNIEDGVKSRMPSNWDLKKNISFDVNINGNIYTVVFKAPEYWKWAENGRKPGKRPPVDAMINFVKKAKITPDNKMQKSIAFLIGRSIGKNGTKGKHFLSNTIDDLKSTIENDIADAIKNDMQIELSRQLSEKFEKNIYI